MLTVVDNLSRALEHLPAEARDSADAAVQLVIDGVELTARDLAGRAGRHGVKRLEPKGEKFDPNFHQAIFEAPDETVARRHGLAGRPERLDDRRSGVASGDGRRIQGRAESGPEGSARVERKIKLTPPSSPAEGSD